MHELKMVGYILIFSGTISAVFAALSVSIGFISLSEHKGRFGEMFRKLFSFLIALSGIIVMIPGTITAPFLSKIIAGVIMIIAGVIYYTSDSLWVGTLKLLIIFDAVIFLIGMVVTFGNMFSWFITPIIDALFPAFFLNNIGSKIGKIVLSFSWRQIIFDVFVCTLSFCAILYLHTKIPKS